MDQEEAVTKHSTVDQVNRGNLVGKEKYGFCDYCVRWVVAC